MKSCAQYEKGTSVNTDEGVTVGTGVQVGVGVEITIGPWAVHVPVWVPLPHPLGKGRSLYEYVPVAAVFEVNWPVKEKLGAEPLNWLLVIGLS
jgi:hypothetical protein